MKRKDVDDVTDDFSEFSLSSPALKIRRLDVDLPPIIEDTEEGVSACGPREIEIGPEENLERAIVLYKSVDASNPWSNYSLSGISVSLDSELLSGLKAKNHSLWSNKMSDEDEDAKRNVTEANCMAVVPWVPSQFLHAPDASQAGASRYMEADDMGEATMDIEEEGSSEQSQAFELGGAHINDGFVHCQQHCMVPNMPTNAPTPVIWFQ